MILTNTSKGSLPPIKKKLVGVSVISLNPFFPYPFAAELMVHSSSCVSLGRERWT